jgi:hypothetical protein
MFRSLFDHLQAEYKILVFENYYINNRSEVLYSVFSLRFVFLWHKILLFVNLVRLV